MPKLNPLFHEPARLAILSALTPAEYVEFAMLLHLTGVSKSALTEPGRAAFDSYLLYLERIVQNARR